MSPSLTGPCLVLDVTLTLGAYLTSSLTVADLKNVVQNKQDATALSELMSFNLFYYLVILIARLYERRPEPKTIKFERPRNTI